MAVTATERTVSAPRADERTRPSGLIPGALEIAAGIQALAFIVLVGSEGSVAWRSVRVSAVLLVTALGILAMRRAGPVGRGTAAFVLGAAGTVAGAGIGGVYAAKVGPSLITVAGMTALATGVFLMVSGAVILIRRIPGWWRLLSIPAFLGIVVLVLYPVTMAVNATNRPATPIGSDRPADHGLSYREVSFQTSDGIRLSGWYVPSHNGAALVLLPGAGSTRTSVLDEGVVLARHGYGVLLLDTRGHGESEGDAMDFGWYGDLDVDAALSVLETRPDVAAGRIGVVGSSMGGEQAIAAGVDPRIRAVVAEGVTGMQAADHGWLAEHGPLGSIQQVIDEVMYGTAGILSGADRPTSLRDAIRAASPRPMLLIAGGATVDEATAGRWFRLASPGSVQLWIVPGSGHTASLATRPLAWEGRVIAFLDAALLNQASPAPA